MRLCWIKFEPDVAGKEFYELLQTVEHSMHDQALAEGPQYILDISIADGRGNPSVCRDGVEREDVKDGILVASDLDIGYPSGRSECLPMFVKNLVMKIPY